MQDSAEKKPAVKVPPNLIPFVETLGEEVAIHLFLSLGGTQIYVPTAKAKIRGGIFWKIVGEENSEALVEHFGGEYVRIPIASQWVAAVLLKRGFSLNRIAGIIRVDVATVRRWVNGGSGWYSVPRIER